MDQVQSSALNKNIDKYIAYQRFTDTLFEEETHSNTGIVITIPALAEPELIQSLESLKVCELPSCRVEVIVVINHSEIASEKLKAENSNSEKVAIEWAKEHSTSSLTFLVSTAQVLPKKHAGAGLARKIAMDEAVVRLQASHYQNPIIACFDADATVTPNYLVSLEKRMNQTHDAWSINCEHPLSNLTSFNRESIMQYELHLRYYQAALAYAKHPQAIFTIGSSMAVTRNAYVKQGGMNRRKAGEDFWFMLKIVMAGNVGQINEATVMPSGRISTRVPFGTGRAMMEMNEENNSTYFTTPLSTFLLVRALISAVPNWYASTAVSLPNLLSSFLETQGFNDVLDEIRLYTTNFESFEKRFFRWFNMFMVMKLAHYVRDTGVKDVPVVSEATHLLHLIKETEGGDTQYVLAQFRALKKVKPSDFT